MMRPVNRRPSLLRAGDVVGVAAPAGPFDRASFLTGLDVLRRLDLVPRFSEAIFTKTSYLAGDDARRGDELLALLRDPDVAAIFCARGGYGSMRLLETHGDALLDAIPKARGLLVGFSDATALHAAWLRAQTMSVHGPVVTSLARVGERSRTALRQLLFEAAPLGEVKLDAPIAITPGSARGPVVGGNLSVLTRLVGSPWMPALTGKILFCEDVGERPYRLDRMLTHLRLSGALAGLAGILLGDFTRCEEPGGLPEDRGSLAVVRERTEDLGIPVLAGLPSGHGDECFPFLHGSDVTLDADRGVVVFEQGLGA